MASVEYAVSDHEKAKTHQITQVKGSVKDKLGSRVQDDNRLAPPGEDSSMTVIIPPTRLVG